MKTFLFTWAILVIGAIQKCSTDGEGPEEFASLFTKFFGKDKDSSKAFQDFIVESGKKMGIKDPKIPGAPGSPEGGGSDGDKGGDKPKTTEEIPVAAKVFAFYIKQYGCTNSKIYEEFIKRYNDGKLPTPPKNDEDKKEDDWLKKVSKKDVDVNDKEKPSVDEAEARLAKLDKNQKKVLTDGESAMPMDAQLFIKFVKAKGCQDKKLEEYKKYNAAILQEIEKNKGKKKQPPTSLYFSKAELLLAEQAEDSDGSPM